MQRLGRNHRLNKDYEELPEVSEAAHLHSDDSLDAKTVSDRLSNFQFFIILYKQTPRDLASKHVSNYILIATHIAQNSVIIVNFSNQN